MTLEARRYSAAMSTIARLMYCSVVSACACTHHPLQNRQPDTRPSHVRAEGVPEAMGVRIAHFGRAPAVAEEAPKSFARHRLATVLPLEDDEEAAGRRGLWTLEVEVPSQDSPQELGHRHRPLLPALPSHLESHLIERHVLALHQHHLGRAQAAQQHQVDEGEIAVVLHGAKEVAHLLTRQRLHDRLRHLHAERDSPLGSERVDPEVSISPRPSVVTRCGPSCRLSPGGEADEESHRREAAVDGPWLRPRRGLRRDELEKLAFLDCG